MMALEIVVSTKSGIYVTVLRLRPYLGSECVSLLEHNEHAAVLHRMRHECCVPG